MSAKSLSSACQFIISLKPLESKEKNLAAIANAARLQRFLSAFCPSIPANPISKEFQSPSSPVLSLDLSSDEIRRSLV
ncbi:hypothetical protein E4T52_15806 [Aureobasidium sp. EXF-3400]|nr:hypothetical protein E4T51_15923 [Aureobasidium sp. EXF-12344]KAI4769136.1 hypothetical protein E4T52_15806 [Aureobasidium sp. EXF-3400]